MHPKVAERKPVGVADLKDVSVRTDYLDRRAILLGGDEMQSLEAAKRRTDHEYQHVLGPAAHRAKLRREQLLAEQTAIPSRRSAVNEQSSVYAAECEHAENRLKGAVEILTHVVSKMPSLTVGGDRQTFNMHDGVSAVREARHACKDRIEQLSSPLHALDAIEAAILRAEEAERFANGVRSRARLVETSVAADLAACDERAEQLKREIAECDRQIEAGAAGMKARDDAHNALAAFRREHGL